LRYASQFVILLDMPSGSRRSDCPVSCTLELLGDRWTLLVVRDLLLGKQRFGELLESPEAIASNILTERLRRLEELELVERTPSETHGTRGTYRLTSRGKSLGPVIKAIKIWGLANIPDTATAAADVLRK